MKRLYRSQSERMISGVLGGIAVYFNIDPTLIRLLFVAAFVLSAGTFLFVYLIAIFIIPNEMEIR